MTPIPGEPLESKAPELTTSDGRKVKLKLPGLKPLGPRDGEEPGDDEPPRDDPAPPVRPPQA